MQPQPPRLGPARQRPAHRRAASFAEHLGDARRLGVTPSLYVKPKQRLGLFRWCALAGFPVADGVVSIVRMALTAGWVIGPVLGSSSQATGWTSIPALMLNAGQSDFDVKAGLEADFTVGHGSGNVAWFPPGVTAAASTRRFPVNGSRLAAIRCTFAALLRARW